MNRVADVIGRYVYLTIDDQEYRVYYEEAGEGIPLLCQHTAGADGRQWRHLLEDPELTADHRIVAHDLPFHGKSLPPLTSRWWEEEYSLTKDFFMKFLVAFSEALELDRPAYIGSSMGGHMAGDLALHHPEKFRAVIGCEAAMHSHGAEPLLPYYYHPRISNEFKPATMYTLCSPSAPEEYRRETVWVYSQGAPVVFKGDLNYYVAEHDLTETAKDIDTSKIDVYILSGEYDWSAAPEDSKQLADAIEGSSFQVMEGLGHFPMCEDYERFTQYLYPVMEEIRAKSAQPVG
jgi:pimeloyl-ACP methyl ester carboxylesterase